MPSRPTVSKLEPASGLPPVFTDGFAHVAVLQVHISARQWPHQGLAGFLPWAGCLRSEFEPPTRRIPPLRTNFMHNARIRCMMTYSLHSLRFSEHGHVARSRKAPSCSLDAKTSFLASSTTCSKVSPDRQEQDYQHMHPSMPHSAGACQNCNAVFNSL